MKKTPDPVAPPPVTGALSEPMFTVRDVAGLSAVSEKTVRNWVGRGVARIGQQHFSGRWLFSIIDALKLAVMHDLAVRLQFSPKAAGVIADFAAANVLGPAKNVIVYFEPGSDEPEMKAVPVKDSRPPPYLVPGEPDDDDLERDALRRVHVTVPVAHMFMWILRGLEPSLLGLVEKPAASAEAPPHE